MEDMFIKLIENTPILAVLAMYMFYSMKSQSKRDSEIAEERQQFLQGYKGISDTLASLTMNLEQQNDILHELSEGVLQAHQYQKVEHEQMIKLLDKLNNN